MLLSIDRVLKMLADGKSIEKISELANCGVDDVAQVIEEAREIINKHDKQFSRKKIIIKKETETDEGAPTGNDKIINEICEGAELTSIPLASSLTMYIDGASKGNPGPAGIGIVILDSSFRQVGKVSSFIGKQTNNFAEYTALIRALKIAVYFQTKTLKVRTDSELIVKQISGEYSVKNEKIKKLYSEAVGLISSIKSFRIEHISRNQNEKADFLAKKASER